MKPKPEPFPQLPKPPTIPTTPLRPRPRKAPKHAVGYLCCNGDHVYPIPFLDEDPTLSLADARPLITTPEEACMLLGDLKEVERETFVALYLDARRGLLERYTVAIGTVSALVLSPREIFARALEVRASSLIVVHNHPSGNTKPSQDDLVLTERLIESGYVLGIPLLDHLIIPKGKPGFLSMKDSRSGKLVWKYRTEGF